MVSLALAGGTSVAVIVVAFIVYSALMRSGGHNSSVLTCPKCGKPFNYDWIWGASFSAVRLWNRRLLQCPVCHELSTFDVRGAPKAGADPPKAG